jgi:hypothetical protein
MAVLRDRRGVGVVAWLLAGFTVLVLVAALVLLGLNADRVGGDRVGAYVILVVAVVVYAGTGRLIASRLPGNAIGWLLCLIGLSLAATMLTEQYALYGLGTAPGSMPAARLAGFPVSVQAAEPMRTPPKRALWSSCPLAVARMDGVLRRRPRRAR